MPDPSDGQKRELLLQELESLKGRYAELEELGSGLAQLERDIVTVTDAEGWIVQASPNLSLLLGHSPEARKGRSIFELLHPEERDRVARDFRASVGSSASLDRLVRVRHADGSWRWLEASSHPFRTASGDLRCVIVSRDVTDRCRRERLDEGEADLLRRLVSECPAPEALQSLVRTTEEAVPEAAASVLLLEEGGRCLRPVAAASLPAGYLHGLDEITTGPGSSPCALAARRGERVWVEDVETDPRCAGPFRERARALGLRACWSEPIEAGVGRVAGTFALYRRQAGAPTEFEQTLLERGCRLAGLVVSRGRVEQERTRRFADQYEQFFQHIRHHAQAILEALPAQHPVREKAALVVGAAERALSLREQLVPIHPSALLEGRSAAPARVMVVDDHEAARDLAFWVLRRGGYEVVTARDGQEAVERFEREGGRFDLVVLDWMMPQLGGEETFQKLRAARSDLPVLFATGHPDRIALASAPEVRTACLAKPFEPQVLLARVREILGR